MSIVNIVSRVAYVNRNMSFVTLDHLLNI